MYLIQIIKNNKKKNSVLLKWIKKLRMKETFDCLQLKQFFFFFFFSLICVYFLYHRLCVMMQCFCDLPRWYDDLLWWWCDGAFGAYSNGASSIKLVVQILSFDANVPTECRRCVDPSIDVIDGELCERLCRNLWSLLYNFSTNKIIN